MSKVGGGQKVLVGSTMAAWLARGSRAAATRQPRNTPCTSCVLGAAGGDV